MHLASEQAELSGGEKILTSVEKTFARVSELGSGVVWSLVMDWCGALCGLVWGW